MAHSDVQHQPFLTELEMGWPVAWPAAEVGAAQGRALDLVLMFGCWAVPCCVLWWLCSVTEWGRLMPAGQFPAVVVTAPGKAGDVASCSSEVWS